MKYTKEQRLDIAKRVRRPMLRKILTQVQAL